MKQPRSLLIIGIVVIVILVLAGLGTYFYKQNPNFASNMDKVGNAIGINKEEETNSNQSNTTNAPNATGAVNSNTDIDNEVSEIDKSMDLLNEDNDLGDKILEDSSLGI